MLDAIREIHSPRDVATSMESAGNAKDEKQIDVPRRERAPV